MRQFDLNIEEMLSHWEPEHALRELIANALDEQALSHTDDIKIEILEDPQGRAIIGCRVRDFGRGLRAEHFTMNENPEKQDQHGVIGKFGVGLKDALATLHRSGLAVRIRSCHGIFSLANAPKHGFEEISTLHVNCAPSDDPSMPGTEVTIEDIPRERIDRAKSMFLRFAGDKVLEETEYGEILEASASEARIYINGVRASVEPDFLFSYNITALTPAMRKQLSRERVNVGRTVYAERVKAILASASTPGVVKRLADQVPQRETGNQCGEMSWLEVRRAANRAYQQMRPAVFVTQDELDRERFLVEDARARGKAVVVVSTADLRGAESSLTRLEDYRREYLRSFQFKFVEPTMLSPAERKILRLGNEIMAWVGMDRRKIEVRVSENMRTDSDDTLGVWESDKNRIVVHRSVLSSIENFAGTLMHELSHASSGAADITRDFENELSRYLGIVAARLLGR
jgi:hypothetical protein